MCIVEKKSNIKNQLNREIVSGNIEIVTPGRLLLHNESLKPLDQLQNPWNKRKYTEDQKSSEIEGVNQESKQLLNAKDVIAEKKLEIERIKQESNELLNAKDYKINSLKKQIKELQEARSWKIIRHLREACVYFNIKKTHAKKLLKKIIYLAKSIDVLILEIYKNLEELGRGSRNADHTIFSNCNDSVSVVYIARNTSDADIDSIDRFIYSYNQYKTNKQHGLHVILKGSGSNYSREDIIRKFDFYCKIHELPDDGYDIGAYIRIAGKIDDQIIIFLNSHSTICCDKWIEKLVNPFIDNKIGLVGCTASFESLSPLGIEFPRTPNPHIRTNGFAIRKKDFAYITKNVVISSKYDAWIFESGFFSLTKRIMNLDKNYIIVDKKGVTYGVESFQIAGTFRNLYRSNQIISDNQHKEYSKYNILNKIRVTLNTWSKCTKNW